MAKLFAQASLAAPVEIHCGVVWNSPRRVRKTPLSWPGDAVEKQKLAKSPALPEPLPNWRNPKAGRIPCNPESDHGRRFFGGQYTVREVQLPCGFAAWLE